MSDRGIMSQIFVSGLSNVETSCAVRQFPIDYQPIDYNFFGISSIPSGVGLNVSLALSALGDEVSFATFVGDDAAGVSVRSVSEVIADRRFVSCTQTPQSVVLYDENGRRRIYTDLKNIQESELPDSVYCDLDRFDGLCLCNINFSRPLLRIARECGKPVFCDVHCLSDIHDSYNTEFMKNSDVLFLSNENILGREESFVKSLAAEYPCRIFVVGMGERGALLYETDRDRFTAVPAVTTRLVVNTVGAGDALFSAFVHFYLKENDPTDALKKAVVFASYKIGESGASRGFLSEDQLIELL